MIFFTSDHHFGHTNILKYEDESRRDKNGSPFVSVDQMNDFLIDSWNSVVGAKDLVYCLGDMSFKAQVIRDILPFLNGEKIMVIGNHDHGFKLAVNGKIAECRDKYLELGFKDLFLHLEIEIPEIGKASLSHFPYLDPHPEKLPEEERRYAMRYADKRPKYRNEKILLHGHVHSNWKIKKFSGLPVMVNVGVDVWNMRPVSETELVHEVKKGDFFV